MKRKIVTNQFRVLSNSGVTAEIVEYTTQVLHRPLSGQEQWINGTRSYESDTGAPFNSLPDGSFQNVITEEVFRPI